MKQIYLRYLVLAEALRKSNIDLSGIDDIGKKLYLKNTPLNIEEKQKNYKLYLILINMDHSLFGVNVN